MGKPFRFEPLLDRVQQREDEQTRVLAALAHEEQALRNVLAALEQEREIEWARFADRDGPLDAERHRVAMAYVQQLTERIETQRAAIEMARGRVAEARDALLEILKEKRSLERLREQDTAAAAIEEGRREANRVDDLNMTRHGRHGADAGTGAA